MILAGQYAIETEEMSPPMCSPPPPPQAPTIPLTNPRLALRTSPPPSGVVAGQVFAATKGQGRVVLAVAPNMLGLVGPLFPSVNPQNAISAGFEAGSIASGPQGILSGITTVMSAGLDPGTMLMFSTAAARAFEYRYGNLQVVEPSVCRACRSATQATSTRLRDRAERRHQDHAGLTVSMMDDPNREAVGLAPIWTGADGGVSYRETRTPTKTPKRSPVNPPEVEIQTEDAKA